MRAWLAELPGQPVCVCVCMYVKANLPAAGKKMDGKMSEGNGHFVTAADYLDYRSDFSKAADWKLMKFRNDAAHLLEFWLTFR